MAAVALADAPVPARPVGHTHRQGQSTPRRQDRRRRQRTGPEHRRTDRGSSRGGVSRPQRQLVGQPQRHQVGRRGAVCVRRAHHGHPGGLRPPLRPGGTGVAGERAGPPGRRCRSRPRTRTAGGHRAGRGHRARHPRLLPAVAAAGQARAGRLGGRGEIEAVTVDGWPGPAYLRAGQSTPRQDRGTALLCPSTR